MDKELKAKWVTALRSGKYKQATGRLYKDGGFCCLGVLAVVGHGDTAETLSTEDGSKAGYEFCSQIGEPHYSRVQDMNDGLLSYKKSSFDEIADYIEQHL